VLTTTIVVADPHVDPEFVPGAVKVTAGARPERLRDRPAAPAAQPLTILDERGVITAHGPFEGLDRFEARPAIVARPTRAGT